MRAKAGREPDGARRTCCAWTDVHYEIIHVARASCGTAVAIDAERAQRTGIVSAAGWLWKHCRVVYT